MPKVLSQYRGYTASVINSRSSATCDHTVVVATVECSNVSLNACRGIVGSSNYSLYDLCTHDNVNRWSGFSPTLKTVSGSGMSAVLTFTKPTQCKLGDFAGYNHTATGPSFLVGGVHTDQWVIPSDTITFSCKVNISELLFTDIVTREGAAAGVAFTVWNGSTLVGNKVKSLATLTNIADFDTNAADRITITNVSATAVYTMKIEIIDSATTYDYSGTHIICRIPGLESWTKTLHAMIANSVYLSADTHWAFAGTTPNFNSSGNIVFQSLEHRVSGVSTNVNHVEVTAYVEAFDNITNTVITSVHSLYHGGPVNTIGPVNHHVWETVDGAADLPLTGTVLSIYPALSLGYGYRCVIFVNEHPA